MQQTGTECEFSGSDSWVILSPIEQSIKRKIEAVGTPLKDWDVQINYGIKTGYNDAFIISTEKREEILANCQSEDERKRTAELIRRFWRAFWWLRKENIGTCKKMPFFSHLARFFSHLALSLQYLRFAAANRN